MKKLDIYKYNFEGQILCLTMADILPFWNDENNKNKVQIGKLTEFKLKDGKSIIGTPQIKNEDFIYPFDPYCDLPLQSKFTVRSTEGNQIVIRFTEIESHTMVPPSNGNALFR